MPIPSLIIYTTESAIAEKFEAMVKRSYLNSRMKDFYDIYHIANNFSFNSGISLEAIKTTFTNRNTDLEKRSLIFSNEFKQNTEKEKQWKSFLQKNSIDLDIELKDCVDFIQIFLEPLFDKEYFESWDKNQLKWIK